MQQHWSKEQKGVLNCRKIVCSRNCNVRDKIQLPIHFTFSVASRSLMRCIDSLRRGVGALHQCPLDSVASYLMYNTVRTFQQRIVTTGTKQTLQALKKGSFQSLTVRTENLPPVDTLQSPVHVRPPGLHSAFSHTRTHARTHTHTQTHTTHFICMHYTHSGDVLDLSFFKYIYIYIYYICIHDNLIYESSQVLLLPRKGCPQ